MKKYLIAIALMFPLFTSAQTDTSATDLQVLIKQLQAQIQSLQAQVVDIQAQVQSVKIELNFSRALAQGATGDDVKQLQEFLKNFTGAYTDGLITGYFGPLTKAAVKKFQVQNGIEPVGIVGPKTQDKLNVLAGAIPTTPATTPSITPTTSATSAMPIMSVAPTIQAAPQITTPATQCINCSPTVPFTSSIIKVLSPNGGEQWQIGGTYTIKYSAKNIVGNEPVLIYLEKGYDAPTTKTGVNSSLLIGVTTNLESYTYTVPQNTQSWSGLGSNYTIKVLGAGAYYANDAIYYIDDSSDALFSIVAGQNNVPANTSVITTPVISVAPVSGGDGGQVQSISQNQTSATTTPATPPNPTTQATQDDTALLQTKISALQNQLNATTDDATRTSLTTQITELKRQLQILEDKKTAVSKQIIALQYQLYYATDATVRASLEAQIIALGGQVQTLSTPTIQDQINALLEKINAYQDKLNKTTDPTTRDSLIAQITAFEAQVQALQNN